MYIVKDKGFQSDATQVDTGVIDYIRSGEGYYSRAVQFDFGRVDYLIPMDTLSGATLIDWEPFFEDYNWEQLAIYWELYRDNWEEEISL